MSKIYFFIVSIFLITPIWADEVPKAQSWDSFQQAYVSYLKNPSMKNVDRICALNPDKKEEKSWGRVVDYMMDNFSILEKRVKNGDRPSIRLVFRLRNIGGGGEFDENLDILLDTLIHSNPKLFLEELKNNRGWITGKNDFNQLLTFMGSDFADQAGQPRKEYRSRIRDLEKSKNPNLKAIRDECINVLQEEIRIGN